MSTNDSEGASHESKVAEDKRRYLEELQTENERLRLLVTSLKDERLKLVDRVQLTSHLLEEHDSMRHIVAGLIQEKLRLQEEVLDLREEKTRRLGEQEGLEQQLANVERESRQFAQEYVEVEKRNNDLTNLYVASYRLHGTMDRQEVIDTIQEIVVNLVGCEEHGIFEIAPGGRDLSLVASTGIDSDAYRTVPIGEGPIGQAVSAGETFVATREPGNAEAPEKGLTLTACIPLKLEGRVTGAIALFRLLPQKASLAEVDHELFELLATHAATALHCTRDHEHAGCRRPEA